MEWLLIAIAVAGVAASVMLQQRRPAAKIPDTAEEFLALTLGGNGELFGDAPGVPFPGPRARTWAYGVLHEAGVDADADPSYAAGILIKAQPKLTKADADALIRTML
ncbi:hypothetical protein [Propioniciclava tarda]|uniref:Uncharacterized protein n=1 Tax=Propioniciclava tarda TaxID=433330 RepID=A0A4Q9KK31_PROTD|nr:hypothetical protein [Propioniciclava tarda]TBT94817.1 hypothetical protein ET996_08500 [Propioniciclava tarda]SMO63066.1 hypothetical protein SAMN06266982_10935 [Propioniciclava tarda]